MATITVKNIPDSLYDQLKTEAIRNHRSINKEIIARIERSLAVRREPTGKIIARARRLRRRIGPTTFTLDELDRARREGRE